MVRTNVMSYIVPENVGTVKGGSEFLSPENGETHPKCASKTYFQSTERTFLLVGFCFFDTSLSEIVGQGWRDVQSVNQLWWDKQNDA